MRPGSLLCGWLMLTAGAVSAGEPVVLAGHTLRGEVQVRLDGRSDGARATSVRDEAEILVRLGPSSDCIWPLRADQIVFSLGDGALTLATGSWSVDARGWARLVLDPCAVEGELRES